MTATLTRRASRYSWVPAAAGWTVGIIATLSLIASVSPGSGGSSGAARVRQRLHLQLPRHQLRLGVRAGLAGRRAGGPQAHRLVDPRAATWSRSIGGTSATSSPATRRDGRHRRDDRARLPRRRGRCSCCWPARSSGRRCGAARWSRRRPRWSPAWPSERSSAGRLLELFPGTPGPRRPVRVRAQPGQSRSPAPAPTHSSGSTRTSSSTRCSACSARWH